MCLPMHVNIRTYVRMYVHTYVCVYVCTYVCVYIRMYLFNLSARFPPVYVPTYICPVWYSCHCVGTCIICISHYLDTPIVMPSALKNPSNAYLQLLYVVLYIRTYIHSYYFIIDQLLTVDSLSVLGVFMYITYV